jgi:hypothetical protein
MAEIEITPTSVIVHIRGADRFFALKSQLEVPLEHIAAVDASEPEAHQIWHGLRAGGTNLPGVITAGALYPPWQVGVLGRPRPGPGNRDPIA